VRTTTDKRAPAPSAAAIITRPGQHELIADALDGARTVVNVGAGAGSYGPDGARVAAVEPSAVVLAQHDGTARVQGAAEALPFPADTFDAAMAIMTIHHWTAARVRG
jgi:ubiquinone/menaquinone biosynthesis C-methylase UbiE